MYINNLDRGLSVTCIGLVLLVDIIVCPRLGTFSKYNCLSTVLLLLLITVSSAREFSVIDSVINLWGYRGPLGSVRSAGVLVQLIIIGSGGSDEFML